MPVLANPRHEAFAQAIVAGLGNLDRPMSQAAAYRAAGYNASVPSSRVCASKLLTFANGVAARIHELQKAQAKRRQVTIETIVDELDEARDIAKDEKQTSAMVSATTTKAKILGLSVERSEVGKPGDFTSIGTSDELASRMLIEAGASLVSDDMKAMAIAEMERHARALAAIARGDASADVRPGSMNKRSSFPSLEHTKPSVSA